MSRLNALAQLAALASLAAAVQPVVPAPGFPHTLARYKPVRRQRWTKPHQGRQERLRRLLGGFHTLPYTSTPGALTSPTPWCKADAVARLEPIHQRSI